MATALQLIVPSVVAVERAVVDLCSSTRSSSVNVGWKGRSGA
jgi:hypothetical protein